MRNTAVVIIACSAIALLLAATADARWAIRPQQVPVERLLENTHKFVKGKPADPQGYYVLGRLHSMAFATGKDEVSVAGPLRGANPKPSPLPSFLPYHSVKVKPGGGPDKVKLSGQQLLHLEASIRHYRKSVELAQKLAAKENKDDDKPKANGNQKKRRVEPRAMLGLAWMYEVADQHRAAIKAAMQSEEYKKLDAETRRRLDTFVKQSANWGEQAVEAYRIAFESTKAADAKRRFGGPGADSLISVDAAQSIIRLVDGDQVPKERKKLVLLMKKHLDEMGRIGRVVTPIVFSLRNTKSLQDLLRPDHVVRFDLDGDGIAARWPWLRGDTCLLVWDPARTGVVKDGRQLFGNATWWIFWDNGYEPLAALDNDHDGWLSGDELSGLSVWRDANGNGRSDSGEVVPVQSVGVRRIAAHLDSHHAGVPAHTRGLQLKDGRSLPTYDWTPTSVTK